METKGPVMKRGLILRVPKHKNKVRLGPLQGIAEWEPGSMNRNIIN
jgi:hypothetical protein